MKTEEFECGDVVVLKSGGPKMTVADTEKDRDLNIVVSCLWFDTTQNWQTGQFYEVMLEKAQ